GAVGPGERGPAAPVLLWAQLPVRRRLVLPATPRQSQPVPCLLVRSCRAVRLVLLPLAGSILLLHRREHQRDIAHSRATAARRGGRSLDLLLAAIILGPGGPDLLVLLWPGLSVRRRLVPA